MKTKLLVSFLARKAFVKDILKRGQRLVDDACNMENKIIRITESKK